MKRFVVLTLVVIVAGGALWGISRGEGEATTSYRFVQVEYGDLEAVVTSTGNLGAVTTVQVGTQVSGIINRIYVDFNDRVRRGQLIARIDTTLLAASVEDANATLERNEAQRNFAQVELDRIELLFNKSFATEVERNQALFNLELADANLKSARISLQRAERNLGYANVYAPINGVVIERNVDEGQTVAASMSAPQLFLIANDLSKLQILASVDESDIGQIKSGQEVRFSVQAYDEETFTGDVRQVRLQSASQDNVVTYTVVVDVDNESGKLLPGMTATVEFLVEKVNEIHKVPNAALRFRPTEAMMAEFRDRMIAMREQREGNGERSGRPAGDSTRTGGQATAGAQTGQRPTGGAGGFGGGFGGGGDSSTLWYLDENGQITAARVRTGLSDGTMTQITGRNLEAGMEIIAGVTTVEQSTSLNPFQQGGNSSGGRRGPGGF